jgi:hypothetical protein
VSHGTWDSRPASSTHFVYGAITLCGQPFQAVQLYIEFLTCRGGCNLLQRDPTTPNIQHLQVWHMSGLGCSPFARRYSGNRFCFLFLRVLRCFSSPRLPLSPMYSVIDTPELPEVGFPIQRSPGQSLFNGSPKLIAVNHVFHRHPAPRHPPSALNSLAIKLFHLCHHKYYLRRF